ncbi:transcription initiation factor TFIID subunit 1 [Paragonimus westermani]|uniref:Transcription initiation factor TFIID subunit 1 n=1 Tax=Paragonimus westermani TaxID=34504 RepID=A0A5J4NMY5_9TREM|nr:transcription initiation factor TFIID subunit 1 [Paragonimus westermani]
MESPNASPDDGPKYKLSSFLFGNVNKQGQIEDYQNDEDLKSINNIDQCHVKEVEETAQNVLYGEPQADSTGLPSPYGQDLLPPTDYYDEQETVPDNSVEMAFHSIKPEDFSCTRKFNEEASFCCIFVSQEDYDSPDPGLPTSGIDSITAADTLPEKVDVDHLSTKLGEQIGEVCSHVSTHTDVNKLEEKPIASPEAKTKPESISLTVDSLSVTGFASEITAQFRTEDDKDLDKMPPPLHPAPIAASRQSQVKTPRRSESPNIVVSPTGDLTDSATLSPSIIQLSESEKLNTPLGSLMPPEYASVDIKDLFPAYNPGRPPRWSSLFKLPHSPRLYQEFIERAPYITSLLAEARQSRHADRLHLVYDGFLDLGEIPLPEEIIEHDDVVELNTPAPPGTDCVAGSEKSWWRRAYTAALAELADPSKKSQPHPNCQENGANKKLTASRPDESNENERGPNHKRFGNQPHSIPREELRLGWRLGPAKYWYDQLGLPLDADVTTWTEWRRPNPPGAMADSSVATQARASDTIKPEETCLTDSPDDQDTHMLSTDGQSGTRLNGVDNVAQVQATNTSDALSSQTLTTLNSANTQLSIDTELPPSVFLPYQLINWEDDIIYDPQLSASKISASSRMNAAYAGWIPSQHCRTMAAFQDAYQGKFPFIVGSKALNGFGSANSVMEHLFGGDKAAHPKTNGSIYSIFPVENQGILSDSWIYDIIYDSDLEPPPPFLLTLDQNDEACLLESVDDVAIAAAINASRGHRQQQQRSLTVFNHTADPNSDTAVPGTIPDSMSVRDKNELNTDEQWTSSRLGLDSHNADSLSTSTGGTKSNMPPNRASLQVSFGLASTRGMLTGALAKAEHGAEKVKQILGKHGLLAEDDWQPDVNKFADTTISESHTELGAEGSALASAAAAVSGIPPKDPLNLSNDEYYAIRSGALGVGGLARCGPLQHSTPAVELWPPFFPTYMSPLRLRQFHRVPLKRYLRGPMAQYNVPFPITNLVRQIQRKAREREEEKAATGGGDIFFMRTPADLSGADGDVVLFEFSEEYPPLMTQVGMASRVINYYRPLTPRDRSLSPAPNASGEPPSLPYGSLVYVSGTDSPFLGAIRPGGYLQVFILRLFLRSTDEPKRIKIEEIRKAFPNHSESSVRKRLKVCADFKRTGSDASWWVLRSDYRLPSEEEVRYLVSPEDCCAHYSMLAAELRLKDAGYGEKSLFVLDENQEEDEDKEGQPKMEDEVRAAPWNTTRAYLASQRGGCFLELHGAADPTGCGEAFSYSKTSAKPGALFRQAGGEVARGLLKGKRTVTGTDADLRKLHLRDARALLRSFGISEADLKTFKRWEIVDMVRFASTERAKQGEEESSAKFARGSRLSMSEQVRCYREECQRIFDLQNRVLSNTELLSSDEEVSSEEEDEEVTGTGDSVMRTSSTSAGNTSSGAGGGVTVSTSSIGGVRLSSLSSSVRSFTNVSRISETDHRREEAEREKLKRTSESGDPTICGKRPRKTNPGLLQSKDPTGNASKPNGSGSVDSGEAIGTISNSTVYEASASAAGTILDLPPPRSTATRKLLRIMRTYSEDGQQYTRTELVPWSPVVEIYLKIRQTRDDDFIHNFVDSDDQFREQQRKEKRRLQDQLRRLRKQQQALMRDRGAGGTGGTLRASALSGDPSRRRRHKPLTSALIKMRCGACGQTGHMRTNKECPMYGRSGIIASEGPRRGLDRSRLKAPPRSLGQPSGNATDLLQSGGEHDPNLGTHHLGVDNVADPIAAAQALASRPVCELLAEQDAEAEADGKPTDGGTTAAIAANQVDMDATEDRSHVDKELDDSNEPTTRFGENDMTVEGTKLKLHSGLTKYIHEQNRRNLTLKIRRQLLDRLNAAAAVMQSANANRRALAARTGPGRGRRSSIGVSEDDFPTSIKHRGNRRRIDPRVALNHIFEGIYKGLTQIAGSKIFMHPVKEKDFPNYYSQITSPMDLSQIRMKINENAYATREEFLADIRLIYTNSLQFNGRFSSYTETAMKMCSHVMEEFCHKELKLMRLESLVNPLLDEDDLVGLSFLLQQAIETMRSVEHSRPFHIPVDKRRYPNYYKTISNPMDLSTLEKMVKENRFHSRTEFLDQVELICSNCVTFNGPESPLSEIAHKMLAAGRLRLEQDAGTLDTIEFNIRRRLESVSEAQQSLSNSNSMADLESAPTEDKSSNSKQLRLIGYQSTGHVRKATKRRADGSTDLKDRERNKKRAKTIGSQNESEIADEPQSDIPNAAVACSSGPIASASDRKLRRRSTDAWYGVDLEYDDDDLDDDHEETEVGELEGNINEDSRGNHASTGPHSEEDLDDRPWVTDDESMDASIKRFSRNQNVTDRPVFSRSPRDQDLDSNTQDSSLDAVEKFRSEEHHPDDFSSGDDDEDHEEVHRQFQSIELSVGHPVDVSHMAAPAAHDAEDSFSEESVDLHDWNHRTETQPGDEYSGDGVPISYLDEDTRVGGLALDVCSCDEYCFLLLLPSLFNFAATLSLASQFSLGDPVVRDTAELAQDLQLTDSDNSSSLSGQGGELCADGDLALWPSLADSVSVAGPLGHIGQNDDDCQQAEVDDDQEQNENRIADPSNRPGRGHTSTTHDQLDELDERVSRHVTFFIGEPDKGQ